MEEIEISPGKKTKVVFQFLYYPEYITKDSYLIINENNLKAFGRVTYIHHDTDDMLEPFGINNKVQKQKRKNSVPNRKLSVSLNEETKSCDDVLDSPTTKIKTHTRRVINSQ